ncbi:UTRA domain-containing protein [Kitasatospora sp. NPDC056731]|uniref:GntR family transcriptional regulator n=1 Tax=Kitasatospora sp. NPDC056731 TaxID=3155422 RepID=UPI003446E4E1
MTRADGQWVSSSAAYLRPQAGPDAWTIEAQRAGRSGTQALLAAGVTMPPQHIQRSLGLGVADQAVLRRRLISLDGRPVELADSWYPASIAEGTGLAELRKIRGSSVRLLADLGYLIARATEDVESRLATSEEASHLEIDEKTPVLVLTRLAYDKDDRLIEASVMVTPGSERLLRYEMKVD